VFIPEQRLPTHPGSDIDGEHGTVGQIGGWAVSTCCPVVWCIEVVNILFKYGYHRAGVAIARSRLDQYCELVREVIASWAGTAGQS
jgi:hypothetical protein